MTSSKTAARPEADTALPPFTTRMKESLGPAALMLLMIKHIGITLWASPLLPFRDWQEFRHRSFSSFWLTYGKAMSEDLPGRSMELIRSATGLVLDIGPGDGSLLHLFDSSKITSAYGPEPAVDMHPKLYENIKASSLDGKYKPLAAGAEPSSLLPALAKLDLIKNDGSTSHGIFDTVVSTRVLCGVQEPEGTAQLLFTLLKPGGRMIISEHIISPWPSAGTRFGYLMQGIYWILGWNVWMGGCTINRDTVRSLVVAGGDSGWKSLDLDYVRAWHPIPYVVGTLIKN